VTVRVLLATEGPSDEVIAERLIQHVLSDVKIDRKQFPARGFSVVQRLVKVFVRAGHFGHYDLLVVHFDLDDTLPVGFQEVSQSPRWNQIHSQIRDTLALLATAHRSVPSRTSIMAPCRSTEAWLAWGREDESGRKWEEVDRHNLKRKLFGDPPRNIIDKSARLAVELIAQLDANSDWLRSLRTFMDDLSQVRDS
jgi:hypothetical protein